MNFTLQAGDAGKASNGYKVYFNGKEVGTFEGGKDEVQAEYMPFMTVTAETFDAVKRSLGDKMIDATGNVIDSFPSDGTTEITVYEQTVAHEDAVKATAVIDTTIDADMLKDANEVVVTVGK